MIKNVYSKNNNENLLLVLLSLLIASNTSAIALSDITLIFALLFSFKVFQERGIKLDFFIVFFIIIFVIIHVFYFLQFGWINFFASSRLLIKFIYAYLTIKILGNTFFPIYEKVLYGLALVSLPLFLIQLIDYQTLFNYLGFLQRNVPFLEYRNDVRANLFFFTLENQAIYRNSGFAWEPKGFASFIALAIIINLMINKFVPNRRLTIFIIAMLTTLSTVGYLILFITIPLFILYNQRKLTIVVIAPIFFLSAAYISTLDFMQSKIQNEFDRRYDYMEMLSDTRSFGSRSLTRMGSLMVDINDFLKKPIIGYGVHIEERTNNYYTYLVRVNGISDHLATSGLIGTIFLLGSVSLSFSRMLTLYNCKGSLILVLIYLIISFGSAITFHPFWIMWQFLFLSIKFEESNDHYTGFNTSLK